MSLVSGTASVLSGYEWSHYANLSFHQSYSNKRGFVAAQSPLESTRTDVWELILQLKTKNIVLLGPLKEGKKVILQLLQQIIAQKHHFHSAGMHASSCAAIDHRPHDEFIAYDVLPLMSQIMCSPFWPNESIHSIEYGQLAVTFVNTTPKPDWEMTVVQVADKNRVSSAEVLYSMYVSIFIPLATNEVTK